MRCAVAHWRGCAVWLAPDQRLLQRCIISYGLLSVALDGSDLPTAAPERHMQQRPSKLVIPGFPVCLHVYVSRWHELDG